MNDIEVTSIDLVEGGNVFKQGHYLTLGYVPRDENGNAVDLSGKTITVALWERDGIAFESAATYSGGVLRFTLNETVPAGNYQIEFTATSSTDGKYRKKFPTNYNSGRISVQQSADDAGNLGISVYTVAQIKSEQQAAQVAYQEVIDPKITTLTKRVDDGVGAFTEDTEIIDARMGKANLRQFNEGLTAQLAETPTIPNTGNVNNREVIINSLNSKNSILLKSGEFSVTDSIPVDGTKNIHISGQGIDKTIINFTKSMFNITSLPKHTAEIVSPINVGDTTIALPSTENIDVGDLFYISTTELMEETSRQNIKTHSAKVIQKDSTSVKLSVPSPLTFNVGFAVKYTTYKSGKIILSDMTLITNYNVDNTGTYVFEVLGMDNPEFRNLKIINTGKGFQGITPNGGYLNCFTVKRTLNPLFENVHFHSFNYDILPSYGSVGMTVNNCTSENGRHLVAPTGGAQNTVVSNCKTYKCYAGFDSHQTAFDTKHINCISYDDEIDCKFRGRNDSIDNCEFSNGVELSNDLGLHALGDRKDFRKTFINSRIKKGGLIVAGSVNVLVDNVQSTGALNTWGVPDELLIHNSTFEGKNTSPTIWLRSSRTSIRNVKLYGSSYGIDKTLLPNYDTNRAFNFDDQDKINNLVIENVEIDGYGIAFDFPTRLKGLNKHIMIRNVDVKNCSTVLKTATNYKEFLQISKINFERCFEYSNEIFRFQYNVISNTLENKTCEGTALPTSFDWKKGDKIINNNPSELGSAGSKYIIEGWRCIASGTPGTWVAMRYLTGA